MIKSVVVLGGGSAGFLAAISIKSKNPHLSVRILRSPDIGIIGVGEGTTIAFPRFLQGYLHVPLREFFQVAEPTFKLGIKFLWGPRREFYYTFAKEYEARLTGLSKPIGFYHDHDTQWIGALSALMAHDKAFVRNADGTPNLSLPHGYHIENEKLVGWLESHARKVGVEIGDANVAGVETGPVRTSGREEKGVTALVLADGQRVTADLFVDASGFRSELLGKALGEAYQSFEKSLFCDRAVIGGWERTDEVVKPYTTVETMDHGWAWQIEHADFINRGYVYSGAHVDDETARQELLRKNPKIPAERTRVVRYRSGRRARTWIGNVVGVGNSVGFVEPLEATSLGVIALECVMLADTLAETIGEPGPMIVDIFNKHNGKAWDDIRDFLAVHYAFNTRLDTPFWKDCREKTDLAGAAPMVEWFRENGPSTLVKGILMPESNSFGFEGYIAMFVGQKLQYPKERKPAAKEVELWRKYVAKFGEQSRTAMSVMDTLRAVHGPAWNVKAAAR